jgi:hypothetical protein
MEWVGKMSQAGGMLQAAENLAFGCDGTFLWSSRCAAHRRHRNGSEVLIVESFAKKEGDPKDRVAFSGLTRD